MNFFSWTDKFTEKQLKCYDKKICMCCCKRKIINIDYIYCRKCYKSIKLTDYLIGLLLIVPIIFIGWFIYHASPIEMFRSIVEYE